MDHGASLLRCKSCTYPHPVNGGLCPYSGCPSCGSTSHSDSSLCEDATPTVSSTKSNEVKFDSKQFEQEFPRPESADAAFQLLKSGGLLLQTFPHNPEPSLQAKIDEIVRTKDCIDLARLAQWAKKNYNFDLLNSKYIQLREIACALDWAPVALPTYDEFYDNSSGGIINNAVHFVAEIIKNDKRTMNTTMKNARAMGCYEFLHGLARLGVISSSDIPPWPPSADISTVENANGGEQNLLLETLRKTMTHVGELLMAGDHNGARTIMKRIPPATARRALAVIPPYRADIIYLLMREHRVVDADVYVQCLQMMESYNYHGRGVTIRVTPFVYPLIEAWSDAVTWNVEPDPFRKQYMTLFDNTTNIPESGDQRAI
eukprot:PhF_6_TR30593/c0_g1_i1/m.45021